MFQLLSVVCVGGGRGEGDKDQMEQERLANTRREDGRGSSVWEHTRWQDQEPGGGLGPREEGHSFCSR